MDVFHLLCLVGCLVLIIPHKESDAKSTSSSILTRIKNKVCSSWFSSRISMCKDYKVEITTTTKPATSGPDLAPGTIITRQDELGLPAGLISILDDIAQEVKQIHSRIGVLITNFTRQAVMTRGPDGLHVDDASLTKLKSTQLKCASECILDDSCLGFAYSQPSKQCQLMSESTIDSGDFIDEPGWRIYYL